MIASAREHLEQAQESYFQHLRFAGLVGLMLVAAGLACLIHSVVPALCRTTASGIVARISELMADRHRLGSTARAASGAMTFAGLVLLSLLPATLMLVGGVHVVSAILALLLAALPVTYLLSNPDLGPVE